MSRIHKTGVYALIHVPTGSAYIGASNDVVGRWTHHRFTLRRGIHNCHPLQKLWNKTTEAEWVFTILAWNMLRTLEKMERHWIKQWPGSVLNLQLNGSPLGMKRTEAVKLALSRAAIRVGADPEERRRRSERAKKQHAQGKFGRQTWRAHV